MDTQNRAEELIKICRSLYGHNPKFNEWLKSEDAKTYISKLLKKAMIRDAIDTRDIILNEFLGSSKDFPKMI